MNRRKILTCNLFAVVLLLILLIPSSAQAEDYEVDEVQGEEVLVKVEKEKHGFFVGIGPALGYEMAVIKQFIGGAGPQFGYRFNNTHSVFIQSDILYTRNRSVNYFFLPILPAYKMTFNTGFFFYAGGGYTYLWAGRGAKFDSNTFTASRSYNGWSVYSGAGYDLWFRKRMVISPQIGIDYTRIASSNIILPLVRINCNWLF